ncbi:MAG: hypothetical protein ACREMA_12845, partial [Longimicrobiales bacterium]
IIFTRQDGSRVQFPASSQVFAWCGDWEPREDIKVPSVRVMFGTPGTAPLWYLGAVVSDVKVGQAMAFPNSFVFDQPRSALLYLADPPNEASSAEDDASGSVTFEELNCRPGGSVRFSINAVLGSEFFEGPRVTVQGSFRAPIGLPPNF